MPLDTSQAQAILAAARSNPDVIWQMGIPMNRNGTFNQDAHLAQQYLDYAGRGYGSAPPDWNTYMNRMRQGWTVTDAFNGRQVGDPFVVGGKAGEPGQGLLGSQGSTPPVSETGLNTPSNPYTPWMSMGPSTVGGPPPPPNPPASPPPAGFTPPPPPPPATPPPPPPPTPSAIPGENPYNPGLLGTASRQWTGAPWRAGQWSNFSGSFFPAFGVQGVANYQYPVYPGGTVTRGGARDSQQSTEPSTGIGPSASYTPRTLVDYTQGGIQMPFRNQFEQYTQSLAMAQPWNPNYRFATGYMQPLRAGGAQQFGGMPQRAGGLLGLGPQMGAMQSAQGLQTK